jgi:hypothetical protein
MAEVAEADESDWPDKATDRLEKLRDRISTWAMAVSSVCVVCAVWMRAPGLDVELPPGGETKMSLNVGYVLALGMPLLLLAYAWAVAPLVALRALQREAIVSASSTPASDGLCGPSAPLRSPRRRARAVALRTRRRDVRARHADSGVVRPADARVPFHRVCLLPRSTVFDAARFESKRRLRLPEHFFGLGAQPASG